MLASFYKRLRCRRWTNLLHSITSTFVPYHWSSIIVLLDSCACFVTVERNLHAVRLELSWDIWRLCKVDGRGSNNLGVDDLGARELRHDKPQEEDDTEKPVEGDPVEDGVGPVLDDSHASVNDPVSQESGVVLGTGGLDSTERVVSWERNTRKVGQQLSSPVHEDEEDVQTGSGKHRIDLRDSRLLLESRGWSVTVVIVVQSLKHIPSQVRELRKLGIDRGDLMLELVLETHNFFFLCVTRAGEG